MSTLRRVLGVSVVLAAVAVPCEAGSILLTSYAQMTPGFDTVTYTGAPFTSSATIVAFGPGNSVTISDGAGDLERRDQNTGWAGNFAPGERLAWTQTGNNNPMTIVFSGAVGEFGLQIQADIFGAFTGSFDVFNGAINIGNYAFAGNSTSAGDDSALFLGARGTGGDVITSVVIRVFDVSQNGDFAINEVSYADGTRVPEPALLTLFGLAAAAGARRFRQRL